MLIVGETWRSSRSESRRRDDAAKRLADVENRIGELGAQTERLAQTLEEKWLEERERFVFPLQLTSNRGLNQPNVQGMLSLDAFWRGWCKSAYTVVGRN